METNSKNICGKYKMLISIIIDNSASMKGIKFDLVKDALAKFHEVLTQNKMLDDVRYEVIMFEGLKTKALKTYDDQVIVPEKMFAGGVPIFSKAVELSLADLKQEEIKIKNSKLEIHKPWMILLMDGQNFGEMEIAREAIEYKVKNNELSYFPFLLSSNDIDESLNNLFRFKRPLQIVQQKYNELFNWIYETIKQRLETPHNQPAQLDLKAFDGWIRK